MDKLLWTQISNIGPPARFESAMTYDSDRDRMVLFSGRITTRDEHGTPTERRDSDTWEFDGTTWAQTADSGPPARAEFSMCYDARRHRTVLYGGGSQDGTRLADTWEWDGQLWTQMAESGPPPFGGPLAYDAAHGYVLMFCVANANAPHGSTWAWDGSAWTQLDDVGAGAGFGVMAYDGGGKRVVLCSDPVSATLPSPTFAWLGSSWKQIGELGPRAGSAGAGMAFDGKELLLSVSAMYTWSWNGSAWVERQDMGPSLRIGFSIAGDTKRTRCVLFGGQESPDAQPETWALRRFPSDS